MNIILKRLNLFASLILFSLASLQAQTAHYRKAADGAALPDPNLTPGVILTTDSAKICVKGYAGTVRNVASSDKNRVYQMYKAHKQAGVCCEIDHLVSLELGGGNNLKNLWPQPYKPGIGAHEKDAVENWLHAQVCSGSMPLTRAQTLIRGDWTFVLELMSAK